MAERQVGVSELLAEGNKGGRDVFRLGLYCMDAAQLVWTA